MESFETVHQLVSTVQGKRRKEVSIVDAIRAAFPGGSMTGAPKIRTMEILDRLEGLSPTCSFLISVPFLSDAPRGVYSGSLGYLSVNDTFDLNIVIRSVVLTHDDITIGAGGAIVLQSDAADEFSEMQLKARALMEAIDCWEEHF